MKKKIMIAALLFSLVLTAVACNSGTTPENPTEAPTTEFVDEAATTEEPASEVPTTEEPTTEEPTTEEPTTEEPTTEEPSETETDAPIVVPTAFFSAEDLATLTPTNAAATLVDGYVHYLTGTDDTLTDPSIRLSTDSEEGFSDYIAIKYRTNCGTYGSNFWGTFRLNDEHVFNGNRKNSDNWFMYITDGTWDVLILDMRRNQQGSSGTPDTDVTGGAAITSLIYNFFDYAGNDGKLSTEDGEEEYIDIEYIAFFTSEDDAITYCYKQSGLN